MRLMPSKGRGTVWNEEVDNTDPWIRFWEVIDKKKAKEIVDVDNGLETVKIRQPYTRTGTGKVLKRWVRKTSDGQQIKESESPGKDRKKKHESHQREEKQQERSISKEKKHKCDCNDSERRKWEEHESRKEKKEKIGRAIEDTAQMKGAEKTKKKAINRGVESVRLCITNMTIAWTCPIPVEQPHWIGQRMTKSFNQAC
uniref:Uncharacterized protein n=1 Tax=Romanomermis culicivorax TaxID=13658 RepID=A0A915KCL3_ROMCU